MRRKGLVGALAAFAASPQGRRMIQQAGDYVRSPEGKRKIAELRAKVGDRGSRGRSTSVGH